MQVNIFVLLDVITERRFQSEIWEIELPCGKRYFLLFFSSCEGRQGCGMVFNAISSHALLFFLSIQDTHKPLFLRPFAFFSASKLAGWATYWAKEAYIVITIEALVQEREASGSLTLS